MRKRDLGKDANGIQKTMRFFPDYLGDGAGQLTMNAITSLGGVLTFFYTDRLGLSVGTIGTLLMVVKLIDALTDLVMGRIVDRTKSRWGKARPWLLWMSIPTAAIIVALFTVPKSASGTVQYGYVFLTNLLATAVIYTALANPYSSLMAMRTQSLAERNTMGIVRAAFGAIPSGLTAVIFVPVTNAMGGGQDAWIKLGAVFSLVSFVCLMATFATAKEQYTGEAREEHEATFLEGIQILLKNKYWIIMLFVTLFTNMVYAIMGTHTYFAKYILGDENLVGVLGLAATIPLAIGALAVIFWLQKYSQSKTTRMALVIGILGTGICMFFPRNMIAAVLRIAISIIAIMPLMIVGLPLLSNTVEYNEWKFGKRLVGLTNSASSFGGKVGAGIGGAMISWLLAFGKYDGSLAVQPDSAIHMILAVSVYLPFVLLVILYLLMRKYDLDEKYAGILIDLKERKSREEPSRA